MVHKLTLHTPQLCWGKMASRLGIKGSIWVLVSYLSAVPSGLDMLKLLPCSFTCSNPTMEPEVQLRHWTIIQDFSHGIATPGFPATGVWIMRQWLELIIAFMAFEYSWYSFWTSPQEFRTELNPQSKFRMCCINNPEKRKTRMPFNLFGRTKKAY